MIAQRGMSGRVRFEQGDAFNPEELSALTPRPTLAIVSGLYELFPENEQVKNSLAGLANAIESRSNLTSSVNNRRKIVFHLNGSPFTLRTS